jgi:hypothetical protein
VPEDAGAPEPVRFTQEQAAAAGAEPPRVFSVGEARELNDVKVKENTAKPEDVYNSSIDNSSESGIIKADGVHSIGDTDENTKPYNESFAYDARVTKEVRVAVTEECELMAKRFGEFDTVKGVDILQTAGTDEGAYSDHSGFISLRHANKADALKKMQSIATQKHESGMWSTANPRHVIRHEIGHAIQKYHKDNDEKWEDKLVRIRSIMKQASAKQNDYELPSVYSGISEDDFISECIAAGLSKKQSKTVKHVIRIIMEV